MESWFHILLPFLLVLGRISGFFAVLPIFSWQSVPVRIRAGLALLVTIFFAAIVPPPAAGAMHWMQASVLMVRELLLGLGLGLAVHLVFLAVQQAGCLIEREMGLAMAEIIDPTTGEETEPMGVFFQTTFALFFLAAGGHRLMLLLIAESYRVVPTANLPDPAVLAEGLVQAGSTMLLLALQIASPVIAASLILSVILAVLSRVLPEMNILMESLPLKVGVGLFMAAAIVPLLSGVTTELAEWMGRLLVS